MFFRTCKHLNTLLGHFDTFNLFDLFDPFFKLICIYILHIICKVQLKLPVSIQNRLKWPLLVKIDWWLSSQTFMHMFIY